MIRGDIRFAELNIHRALESYAPKLSDLSAFLLPGREMANWVDEEVAIAKSKDPLRPIPSSEAFRTTLDAGG